MLKPVGDSVILRELAKETVTKAGIILAPDQRRYETLDAEVIAVNETNERKLKPGQTVIVDKAIMKEAKYDGILYLIVPESCIIAVIDGKKGK